MASKVNPGLHKIDSQSSLYSEGLISPRSSLSPVPDPGRSENLRSSSFPRPPHPPSCEGGQRNNLRISVSQTASPFSPKTYATEAMQILRVTPETESFPPSQPVPTDPPPTKIDSPPKLIRSSSSKPGSLYQTSFHEGTGEKSCRRIKNKAGVFCEIKPVLDEEGKTVHGTFSKIYAPKCNQPGLHPDTPNDLILIKILRPNHLTHAHRSIELSIEQYRLLQAYFKRQRETNPPIVTVYNPNEAPYCGYTLVERVTPFKTAPWDNTTRISDFSSDQKLYFNTVIKLILASNKLKARGKSPLDLKWPNLGKRSNNQLVLIDYVNIPFSFSSISDSYPRRLGRGNSEIEVAIEKKIS